MAALPRKLGNCSGGHVILVVVVYGATVCGFAQAEITDVSKVTSAVLSLTVADGSITATNILTVLGLPYTSWGEHSVNWCIPAGDHASSPLHEPQDHQALAHSS